MIDIFCDLPFVPKGRPRFNSTTGKVYTPRKTIDCEDNLRWFFVRQKVEKIPACCPIYVDLSFCYLNKRNSKKPPQGRPDVDNLAKLVLDAGNGILWDDDSQIVKLTACKSWSETPGVRIFVDSLDYG
jgi:Holliday junction resolvase RusA-like endonuclease